MFSVIIRKFLHRQKFPTKVWILYYGQEMWFSSSISRGLNLLVRPNLIRGYHLHFIRRYHENLIRGYHLYLIRSYHALFADDIRGMGQMNAIRTFIRRCPPDIRADGYKMVCPRVSSLNSICCCRR